MVLFNDNWEFSLQPLHTTLAEMNQRTSEYKPVGIPHDWLIYDGKNLYKDGTGWYRKRFTWQCREDQLVFLRFGGIYMDSKIFVNDQQAFEWKYGYSTFEVDITPYLVDGENEIKVSVDFQSPNSRWYSGAGIYRNVWLKTVHKTHLVSDGIYFYAKQDEDGSWHTEIESEVLVEAKKSIQLTYELAKAGTEEWVSLSGETSCVEKEDGLCVYVLKTCITDVETWDIKGRDNETSTSKDDDIKASDSEAQSPKKPTCYQLRATLASNGVILQQEKVSVGFRTIEFSPEQGFLLNGRKVKLNGVCEHHDLGCLGSAYHPKAMRRKLQILKEMGVNAIRLTHNMHDEHVLDLADEMGFLLISEAFDMWESAKTPYDYARFFPQWYKKDVSSWVRRDRNHPSVIMWSIGNEIHDTHVGKRGQELTRMLLEEVAKHDGKGHAKPTIGSNYMPWEHAQKCADIVKLAGYNYAEKYYEEHHKAHPDWIIYGSETASTVQSRGIYHFPYEQSVLADEDEQCSSLGNSTTSWGAKSTEACIIAERDHTYSCGQFLWTGFDYIGEPTPYHTRNSYFGQVDTAGFPKDSYYMYQAEWTDYKETPMVHLFPYWDFNEGQMIDVRICSNAPKVELFVNEKSYGVFEMYHEPDAQSTEQWEGFSITKKSGSGGEIQLAGHWKVPYVPGEIRAVAYDEAGNVIAMDSHHSFGEAAKICLKSDCTELRGDGQDLLFVEISMEDEDGYPVENANNRVTIRVEGQGHLVGLDNGDSTDTDEYKGYSRRLFSGKLLAVFKSDAQEGSLKIVVSSKGLPDAILEIPVAEAEVVPGSSVEAYLVDDSNTLFLTENQRIYSGRIETTCSTENRENVSQGDSEESVHPEDLAIEKQKIDIPVRNIRLTSDHGLHLHGENLETTVTAELCPANATDREVIWSIVNDAGIPSTLATITPEGTRVSVKAKSDGKFRLRCMSRCGTGKIRIISQLEFEVTGLGEAYLNPYEFVSAGLYDYSKGTVGNGNEHGVATARDGETQVGFHEIDFGPYGSDEICLPIFALGNGQYRIRIYEGMPEEETSELIADVIYQKPSIWNVYQAETYKLNKRLKGVTGLCFVLEDKIHLKGFTFTKFNRAWERNLITECDTLYGDSFLQEKEWIRQIGNNVTIEFEGMDFGTEGATRITICGSTPLEKNTISVRFVDDETEEQQMLEFVGTTEEMQELRTGHETEENLPEDGADKMQEQTFTFEKVTGVKTVRFVFLPGSNFDFHWFRFEK